MSEPFDASAALCARRPLRLLVADDQALIRRGLALMLGAEPGMDVVAQAANGAEALAQSLALQPDVVLMDLHMPQMDGIAATRQIVAQQPQTKVVVLTTFAEDEQVYQAVLAGAQGYLLKDASEAELIDTIHAVHRGESRLSPLVAHKVLGQLRALASAPAPAPAGGAEALSAKEAQILQLIAQGLSNKDIAARVFLAEGTVKNHVSRIMDKLHTHNRTALALKAASR